MSNSTQNDEIKQMERAINEGFAESEKFLKGMKTPFDEPSTQNDIPKWSKRLQEVYDKGYEKGLADARREVGNGIEKMYLSVADEDPRYDTAEEIQAYNQAIYEILDTLKEEKI